LELVALAAGNEICDVRRRLLHGRGVIHAVVVAPVVILASCSGNGGSHTAAGGIAPSTEDCAATIVHYGPDEGAQAGLAQLPWIAASPSSSGVVGHLFYYDRSNIWKMGRLPRLRMYSGGQSPDGRVSMKILWELLGRGTPPPILGVQAKRLDGSGSFSQELPSTSSDAEQFPSIIDVPTPGCWRLTLKAGTTAGHVTIVVVPGKLG
jgi:hypothetical protein